MTNDIDKLQEKLLDEKLGRIQDSMTVLHTALSDHAKDNDEVLGKILAQTKKTNGRVNKLEEDKDIKNITKEGNESKIELLMKETELLRIAGRYPKLTMFIVTLMYLIAISDIRNKLIELIF